MNNISFQGKTTLCISPNAYRRVTEKARSTYSELNKKSNCMLRSNKTFLIDTDPEALTVIVKNNDNGFLKYLPVKKDITEIINKIESKILVLKEKKQQEPLTAWIVGGTKLDSPLGQKVSETLNKIAKLICDRHDIDTSILVGSKTGEEKFIIHNGKTKLKLDIDKKINSPNNLEPELENMFDIVELNNTKLVYKEWK